MLALAAVNCEGAHITSTATRSLKNLTVILCVSSANMTKSLCIVECSDEARDRGAVCADVHFDVACDISLQTVAQRWRT